MSWKPEMRDVVAIIPAAGSGSRMKSDRVKVLLEIEGQTVLERTVATITALPFVAHTVVTARAEELEEYRRLLPEVSVVQGGATRQESVALALNYLGEVLPEKKGLLVMVHDAARCLASTELFERCVSAARTARAVSAAVPVVDSVKSAGPDKVVEHSLERSRLWAIQTPQVFDLQLLADAHSRSAGNVATDDASLVEVIHPVQLVDGERSNIKITYEDDLELASFLIGRMRAKRK